MLSEMQQYGWGVHLRNVSRIRN